MADPHFAPARANPPSVLDAFRTAYPTVRAACAAPNAPGIAIFAVDSEGLSYAIVVGAHRDRIQPIIVGRHAESDVALVGDDSIALRHLTIIVHPASEDRLWFRIIDLRTETGFRDERDERIDHMVADGPVFINVGKYCLFIVPLCDKRLTWPEKADMAWKGLPKRVYQTVARGDGLAMADSRTVAPPLPPVDPDATLVQDVPGPRFARPVRGVRLIGTPDEPAPALLGELIIATSTGASASVLVDQATARSGLILGRSDKCDNAGLALLDDPRISRVHVLLLEIEGVFYAIDTASTNGVWRGGADAGGVALSFGQRITIARGLAWVKWMAPPK